MLFTGVVLLAIYSPNFVSSAVGKRHGRRQGQLQAAEGCRRPRCYQQSDKRGGCSARGGRRRQTAGRPTEERSSPAHCQGAPACCSGRSWRCRSNRHRSSLHILVATPDTDSLPQLRQCFSARRMCGVEQICEHCFSCTSQRRQHGLALLTTFPNAGSLKSSRLPPLSASRRSAQSHPPPKSRRRRRRRQQRQRQSRSPAARRRRKRRRKLTPPPPKLPPPLPLRRRRWRRSSRSARRRPRRRSAGASVPTGECRPLCAARSAMPPAVSVPHCASVPGFNFLAQRQRRCRRRRGSCGPVRRGLHASGIVPRKARAAQAPSPLVEVSEQDWSPGAELRAHQRGFLKRFAHVSHTVSRRLEALLGLGSGGAGAAGVNVPSVDEVAAAVEAGACPACPTAQSHCLCMCMAAAARCCQRARLSVLPGALTQHSALAALCAGHANSLFQQLGRLSYRSAGLLARVLRGGSGEPCRQQLSPVHLLNPSPRDALSAGATLH